MAERMKGVCAAVSLRRGAGGQSEAASARNERTSGRPVLGHEVPGDSKDAVAKLGTERLEE